MQARSDVDGGALVAHRQQLAGDEPGDQHHPVGVPGEHPPEHRKGRFHLAGVGQGHRVPERHLQVIRQSFGDSDTGADSSRGQIVIVSAANVRR